MNETLTEWFFAWSGGRTTSNPEKVWDSMKPPAREKRTYSRLWKIFLFSLTFRRDSTRERNFYETLKSFAYEVEKSLTRDKDHLPTSAPHSVVPAPKNIKEPANLSETCSRN